MADNAMSYLAQFSSLWSPEFEKKAISILKEGKTGKRLENKDYYVLQTCKLVSVGGTCKVARKNGKLIATQETALNVIAEEHAASGHGGEKKTHGRVAQSYANISRAMVAEYIKRCEVCAAKHRRKAAASGVVPPQAHAQALLPPLAAADPNERSHSGVVDKKTRSDGKSRQSCTMHTLPHVGIPLYYQKDGNPLTNY